MSARLSDAVKAIRERRAELLGAALCALTASTPVQGGKSLSSPAPSPALKAETASTANAGGLPRNPQRPFTAQSCEAAQARLAEAEAGSSLISALEMARVFEAAQSQAERLCPPAPVPVPDN